MGDVSEGENGTKPPASSQQAPISLRPPSVDVLARSMAGSGVPHPLLVNLARRLITERRWTSATEEAAALRRTMLTTVINATGVMLHTNLGRAPVSTEQSGYSSLEFDLTSGRRGSRQRAVGSLVAAACGAEAAIVVNNNAAAVMLVLAALAHDRDVLVARGESVEIGGGFRIPDVMEQSGARLRDVGTTNRTRLDDYRSAIGPDSALILKIHPSNYKVEGFVEETSIAELATLGVVVVVDIGSGLLDAACPWLPGGPPSWLSGEPAARQTLEAGAALVTFSGDKLLGGPQSGIIAGRADLIAACGRHPLARALRPGGLVLAALQETLLAYLRRDAGTTVPFWAMVSRPLADLQDRAEAIIESLGDHASSDTQGPHGQDVTPESRPMKRADPGVCASESASGPPDKTSFDTPDLPPERQPSGPDTSGPQDPPILGRVSARTTVRTEAMDALPGAGSLPGVTVPSWGLSVAGDHLDALRTSEPPIIARVRDGRTILDLRTVEPFHDAFVAAALSAALTAAIHMVEGGPAVVS